MAATPTADVVCGKCGSDQFDMAEGTISHPIHSAYSVNFVRCASCKTAVGVLDGWLAARIEAVLDLVKAR